MRFDLKCYEGKPKVFLCDSRIAGQVLREKYIL
jgi:hypothetical protein